MHKKWVFLVVSMMASVLYAQSKEYLDHEDLLQAFQQYNPSVLENAATNETYGSILHQLVNAYKIPNTIENQAEMIALAKNFDNSLQLYALNQAYNKGRALQMASGASLDALNTNIETGIEEVLRGVYRNTLDVKKIQIKQYKQKIKEVKKDKELSAEQQKEQITTLKEKIKKTKQEVRSLKKNASSQIKNTAQQYLEDMRAAYDKAQAQQLQVAESKAQNVKADHKKPVAK